MGVQVRCPLCGWTSPPDGWGEYDLAAKDVRSLGGDRGFEHVEIEPPVELKTEVELGIARLYHRYVDHDPYIPPDPPKGVGAEIEEEIAAAVDDRLVRREIEAGIEAAVEDAVGDSDLDEVEEEIAAAAREGEIRGQIAAAVKERLRDGSSP